MTKIPYNVDAYTAKLIGRENLSKVDSAIIELVKNTYDADADLCILYLDEDNNTLYLCDNGTGMNERIIKDHWMTIGHSSKVVKYKTQKGRIQTGSKGIGRFALDRIARKSTMYTCRSETKLVWKQDWAKFEPNKRITDIYAELDEVNISFDQFCNEIKNNDVKNMIKSNFKNGTIFKMSELEDKWDEHLFKRIKKTLISIASPELESVFKIFLFNNTTTLDDAKITSNLINQYDYKIEFDVNQEGVAFIQITRNEFNFPKDFCKTLSLHGNEEKNILKNDIVLKKNLDELLPMDFDSLKSIGQLSGSLYFLKASITQKQRETYMYKDITGRISPSKKFGGIKIYRDNFKVRPYGDIGTSSFDWLMLSARKASSPGAVSSSMGSWKVRGEQVVGQINISRTNLTLADQANREGIVETREFNLFKDLIVSILELFERDRQYIVSKISQYNSIKQPHIKDQSAVKEFLDNKNRAYTKDYYEKIKPAIEAVISEKDKKIITLENEISMLTSLATTGIVTNTYIHELKGFSSKLFTQICNAKETIEYMVDDYREGINIEHDIKDAYEIVKNSYQYNDVFNSWFGVTIGSISKDRRTMKKHNIHDVLNKQIESWKNVLESKDIIITFKGDNNIEVRCFSYEIDSIISNLITNSVSAFDSNINKNNGTKEINISLRDIEDGFIIEYNDNGPGLVKMYKKNPEKIFEAFESDKRSILGEKLGTGMGMWIVKRNVDLYKGSINLSKNKFLQTGFYIEIKIKARR